MQKKIPIDPRLQRAICPAMKIRVLFFCFLFPSILLADEYEHCAVVGLGVGSSVFFAGLKVSGLDYPAEFSLTNWAKLSNFVSVGIKKAVYYTVSLGAAGLSVSIASNICMNMMERDS